MYILIILNLIHFLCEHNARNKINEQRKFIHFITNQKKSVIYIYDDFIDILTGISMEVHIFFPLFLEHFIIIKFTEQEINNHNHKSNM